MRFLIALALAVTIAQQPPPAQKPPPATPPPATAGQVPAKPGTLPAAPVQGPYEFTSDLGAFLIVVKADKVGGALYKVHEMVEKPALKDAPSNLAVVGKYIITPDVIRTLRNVQVKEGEELRLAHALDIVARKGDIYGVELEGEWLDCGSKIGFLKATVRFGLEHPETGKEFKEFLKTLK